MSEQLPPYLRRAPDGRLQLVLHPTGVQTYKVCPLKFQLRVGWEIELAVPRTSLNYGGAIHAAKAYRYAHPEQSLDAIEREQAAILEQWFAAHPQPDDEWRNLGRALDAIHAYNEEYPTHEWTVLAVEETFSRKVGEITDVAAGETVDVILEGRKDLVVAWANGLWVVDHKTASEWGSDPAKNQALLGDRRSFQFRAYTWEERERQREAAQSIRPAQDFTASELTRVRLPVKGVVGNYIVGRRPFSEDPAAKARRTSAAKARDEFAQEPYPFDDATLDEWREECLLVAARILRDWRAQRWEQSFDRGCAHYGRCEFYDYCEETPATREAVLSSSRFRHRETEPATLNGEEP